ncbi:cx9C motif-containing protein 4-like isoform X2 [Oratosquilla oratoria]|uniref:cx9C motif-containing protein 4-like isoform X2 n=1 Tax=Oratosquilla oratoria TaxID=337810 RepID=UPI003F75978C
MKGDPCQKRACAIQYCLQANKYQEASCKAELEALARCCERWGEVSKVCDGIKKPVENKEENNEKKPDKAQ